MQISKKQGRQLKRIALTRIPSFKFIKLKQDLCQKVCTLEKFVTGQRYGTANVFVFHKNLPISF